MRRGSISKRISVLLLQALLAAGAAAQGRPVTTPAQSERADPRLLLQRSVAAMQSLMQAGRMAEVVRVAEQVYQQLEAEAGAEHPLTVVALLNLGAVQRQTGAIAEAVVTLQRALAIEARLGSPSRENFRRALKELAEAEKSRGQSEAAVSLYDAALNRLRREVAGTMAEAELLEEQAVLLRHLGDFRNAEEKLTAALAIKQARLAAADAGLLTTLTHLGGVARLNGRYSEAETYYKRALAIVAAEKGQKNANYAILLDNLGVLYADLGRHGEAETQHKQALEIFETTLGHDHVSTGQCVANLGAAAYQQRRYAEAEKLLERALAIYRRALPANDWRLGVTLDNLAGIYRGQRRYDRAADSYRQALDILRQAYSERHPDVGTALNNLALMNVELGRLPEAQRYAGEALSIAEATYGPSHIHVAYVLNNVGLVHRRQGRLPEARAAFERAIAIVEREVGAEHGLLVHPLSELGAILLVTGEARSAHATFRRAAAIELKRRARGGSLRAGDAEPQRLDPFIGLVEAAWLLDASDGTGGGGGPAAGKASGWAEDSLGEAQWVMMSQAGRAVAQLGARLGARTPALAALARERQDLSDEWVRIDRRLTLLLSQPGPARTAGDDADLRQRLGKIDTRLGHIDAALAREHPGFAELALPKPLAARELRALLTPGEALLAFFPADKHVYAWLVTRGELRWQRIDLAAAELEVKVRTLRCGLDPGAWVGEAGEQRCRTLTARGPVGDELPFDLATAASLHDALIRPFAAAIEGRHVLVAASGALSSLPLQVLVAEAPKDGKLAGAKWLGLRNAMTTLPSIASLKSLRRDARASAAPKPYFGIGNPLLIGPAKDYSAAWGAQSCLAAQLKRRPGPRLVQDDAGIKATLVRGGAVDVQAVRLLSPLPETRDELCAVAASNGAGDADLALGSRASEKHLRDLSASGVLRGYRTVHFATHGLVAGEVAGLAEAALVLTPPAQAQAAPDDDGLLTASEVASLRLDADWVILSACNTAAGDALGAEALSGLARAFFHAGARSLLVSHWPVQSAAAVKLTTRALAELRKAPRLGRAEALRRSMLALASEADDPLNAHPQVWAPFVVVGEGGGSVAATPAPSATDAAASAAITPKAGALKPTVARPPREELPWLKGRTGSRPAPPVKARDAVVAPEQGAASEAVQALTSPATPVLPATPASPATSTAAAAKKAAQSATVTAPAKPPARKAADGANAWAAPVVSKTDTPAAMPPPAPPAASPSAPVAATPIPATQGAAAPAKAARPRPHLRPKPEPPSLPDSIFRGGPS